MQKEEAEYVEFMKQFTTINEVPGYSPSCRREATMQEDAEEAEYRKFMKQFFPEQKDTRFMDLAKKVKSHLKKFSVDYANDHYDSRFISQCKETTSLFTLIIDNVEYIFGEPRFRKYSKNGYSFVQICISKCAELYTAISAKYDSLRVMNKRSNPTLRKTKIDALNTIQNAKNIMCKHYTANPVEKETVEHLITKHI